MDHARQQSILTVNTGSSSLKAALYPLNGTDTLEIGVRAERIVAVNRRRRPAETRQVRRHQVQLVAQQTHQVGPVRGGTTEPVHENGWRGTAGAGHAVRRGGVAARTSDVDCLSAHPHRLARPTRQHRALRGRRHGRPTGASRDG